MSSLPLATTQQLGTKTAAILTVVSDGRGGVQIDGRPQWPLYSVILPPFLPTSKRSTSPKQGSTVVVEWLTSTLAMPGRTATATKGHERRCWDDGNRALAVMVVKWVAMVMCHTTPLLASEPGSRSFSLPLLVLDVDDSGGKQRAKTAAPRATNRRHEFWQEWLRQFGAVAAG